LEFGTWNLFGIWCLVLGILVLRAPNLLKKSALANSKPFTVLAACPNSDLFWTALILDRSPLAQILEKSQKKRAAGAALLSFRVG
jgi:hypothetical protein